MPEYEITEADRRPLPARHATEHRYLGYRAEESSSPFAHYFEPTVRPVQEHVLDALLSGRSPQEFGYEVDDAVSRLSAPGHHHMETGWTRTGKGTLVVACRTDMPGVTARMWDWWFGWHSRDSARYKLWHPDAHQFCAVAEDRGADRALTDRQRYHGNVSYVDEYIGGALLRLAIRFVDPARLGFADTPGTTHICALVGVSDLPVATGWFVHQVRPTDEGVEMRSRFFLGDSRILDLPAHSVSSPTAARLLTSPAGQVALAPAVAVAGRRAMGDSLGPDLLRHCAAEMNHLAGFLPKLHEEFGDLP
ncbi:DAPG hydrolase family protein [Actinokineospora sp. G85]|uniref:DAPG hydrolase family protein n=1 Tax=Actinokineospora sp. G85 TaxID=3406626 RepID=UPI003C74DD7D